MLSILKISHFMSNLYKKKYENKYCVLSALLVYATLFFSKTFFFVIKNFILHFEAYRI